MKKFDCFKLFISLGLCLTSTLGSTSYKETLAKVYIHYSKAEYADALKKLKTVKGNRELQALVHYWNGKVFSKTHSPAAQTLLKKFYPQIIEKVTPG